ncbi:MAG: hypothetical protein EOP34_07105 [Rickettsiales bacterium]|nr:MAG: hypothetical protein EOP34_07105 [Rickettsiales bacterium]
MTIFQLILSRFSSLNKGKNSYNGLSAFISSIFGRFLDYSREDILKALIKDIRKLALVDEDRKILLNNVIENINYLSSENNEEKIAKTDKIINILAKTDNLPKNIQKHLSDLMSYREQESIKSANNVKEDSFFNKVFFKKSSKIYNIASQIIFSKAFIYTVSMISASIALSAATAGIFPILSFAGTLLIISSSIIYDIYQMKKHKSLVQERDYLRALGEIHNEKNEIIKSNPELSVLEDKTYVKSQPKTPNQPSYIRSLLRTIKQKLPATTITLILQVATLNPLSIAIAFSNSIIGHIQGTLSRQQKDDLRYFTKENIATMKNNDLTVDRLFSLFDQTY